MYLVLLKGFMSSAGLIVAIGAQNAFVIRQGLMQNHLLLTAFLCSLIDAILITIGVLGFGQIIAAYPLLIEVTKYFAIAFLFAYGALSLKSAFKHKSLETERNQAAQSRTKTVLFLLALSLLNPHVYLDTVILLGSIASQHPLHEQLYFTIGAVAASFIWFFSICYGSRFLAPYLCNSRSWKIIDICIAIVMWGIAVSLGITL
jgi:L-lysine exporter family protein LysE/ArgO